MKDPLLDDDFLYDFPSSENIFTSSPHSPDRDTFKTRVDTQDLIRRLKLQLMNAFEKTEEIKNKDGTVTKKTTVQYKKNTTPLASKQGIEEIIGYVERIFNSHIVMGNITDAEMYNSIMLSISDDITAHFVAKRKDWKISIKDCDILISTITSMFSLFLTRLLGDGERKSLTEGYKETTSREIRPETKPNLIQKIGSFLAGSGGNK